MANPFSRILIDNIIAGGTRVAWEMDRHFVDPAPYVFQLQFSHVGLSAANDWIDVDSPVTDTFFAYDTEKRLKGLTLDSAYRVKLTTANGTYYSKPEMCDGKLSKRDWLTAREIVRKELLRHNALTSVSGYLLKVRRYGPRCTTCTDPYTEEVTRSNCPTCYGTGFTLGYYTPLAACYADIGSDESRDRRDGERGTTNKTTIVGRFIGDPLLYSYDVWVNGTSDERFYIQSVQHVAHVRGVAVVVQAELRLAPYSDIVYTVPLTGAVAEMTAPDNDLPLVSEPELVDFPPLEAPKPCRYEPSPTMALNYLEQALNDLRQNNERSTRSRKR